jgi:hypothetical protein
MSAKRTEEQFLKEMLDIHPTIKVLEKYIKKSKEVKCECLVCKNIFSKKPSNLVTARKSGCPKCSKEKETENRIKTRFNAWVNKTKELVDELEQRFPGFIVLRTQKTREDLAKIECNKGHIFYNKIRLVLKTSYGCPICAAKVGGQKNRLTEKEIKRRIKNKMSKHNHKIKLISISEDPAKSRVKVICYDCDSVFETTLGAILGTKEGYTGCRKCAIDKNKRKTFTFKLKGKKFIIQGYEHLALEELSKKYEISAINAGLGQAIPQISYKFKGKSKTYYPDIFIPHKNLIIEVKSDYTLGLYHNSPSEFNKVKKKAKACIKQGFKFKLYCYNSKKEKIKLPINWIELTRRQVLRYITKV